jgi:ubiquinone/menaquinone biosynthesis C-methylase UbiE
MDQLSLRKSIRQGFDKIAADYAPIRTSTGGRETREFVRWIQPRRSDCVLDAASGAATLARRFIWNVKRVYAVDLSERMIHLTPRPAASGAELLLTVGDVGQLPYASGSFQLVTCAYAFANFPDPLKVLREFIRVIDEKGRIALLDVIAPQDPVNRSRLNLIEGLRSHFYTRILDRSQFTELFRVAGLRLESSQVHHRYQNWREWLRLSPAAANPEHARRLRAILLQSSERGRAGLITRREDGEIVLCYETAWFLLRRLVSPVRLPGWCQPNRGRGPQVIKKPN